MNNMDCMCADVYFHERRETLWHDFWYMSSNIIERVHAIFGSEFEWNFAPSAQLRNHFARDAKDISENPAGLFLAPLIPVYRVSLRSGIDEFLATWQYSTVCINNRWAQAFDPAMNRPEPSSELAEGRISCAPIFPSEDRPHTSAIPSYTPRGYNPGIIMHGGLSECCQLSIASPQQLAKHCRSASNLTFRVH